MQAVLADWRTAPIDEKLRATLGLLQKLTLSPADVAGRQAEAGKTVIRVIITQYLKAGIFSP